MKEYSFRVKLNNQTEINATFHAKNEDEAWIMIKRQYPPIKGFTYELINIY